MLRVMHGAAMRKTLIPVAFIAVISPSADNRLNTSNVAAAMENGRE